MQRQRCTKPPEVAEAVKNAILTAGNAARGAHGASLSASRMVFETRSRLAALFGCPRADHVVFTANSTEALNIAIYGLISAGDHVISTDLEHNSVLRPLYDMQTRGAAVDFVRADRRGNIRYEDMEALFRPNTKAVVCTHASNLTGNPLDIARIGAMAHAHGALLVVDASQTAGAAPIDMQKMGIDVLCFTGHKGLMGPQGTGGLCIRPAWSCGRCCEAAQACTPTTGNSRRNIRHGSRPERSTVTVLPDCTQRSILSCGRAQSPSAHGSGS